MPLAFGASGRLPDTIGDGQGVPLMLSGQNQIHNVVLNERNVELLPVSGERVSGQPADNPPWIQYSRGVRSHNGCEPLATSIVTAGGYALSGLTSVSGLVSGATL